MKKDSKTRLFEVMVRLDKTFKPKLNEEFETEKSEINEPTEEGISYKAKLEEIITLAKKAYENLPEGELPSWVQDKIVIAKEHLNDIGDFLHAGEEHEEKEMNDTDDVDNEEETESEEKSENDDDNEETEEENEEESEENEEDETEEETKKLKIPVANIAKANKK